MTAAAIVSVAVAVLAGLFALWAFLNAKDIRDVAEHVRDQADLSARAAATCAAAVHATSHEATQCRSARTQASAAATSAAEAAGNAAGETAACVRFADNAVKSAELASKAAELANTTAAKTFAAYSQTDADVAEAAADLTSATFAFMAKAFADLAAKNSSAQAAVRNTPEEAERIARLMHDGFRQHFNAKNPARPAGGYDMQNADQKARYIAAAAAVLADLTKPTPAANDIDAEAIDLTAPPTDDAPTDVYDINAEQFAELGNPVG